jgi:hypothetical protein
MGYACPVCEAPQRDAEHLANHLAFTAMLRGGDHEAWLDEYVPDWGETNADELAPRVAGFAAETTYEEVFEDTVQRESGAGRGDLLGGDHRAGYPTGGTDGTLDADDRAILQEARELTRRMTASAADEDGDGDATGGATEDADEAHVADEKE